MSSEDSISSEDLSRSVKMKEFKLERVKCACGAEIAKQSVRKHLQSERHQNKMLQLKSCTEAV